MERSGQGGRYAFRIPLGRFASPEEVGEVILFLLTNAAAMLNGIAMPIDGGFGAV